jgi:hypothetical protein
MWSQHPGMKGKAIQLTPSKIGCQSPTGATEKNIMPTRGEAAFYPTHLRTFEQL